MSLRTATLILLVLIVVACAVIAWLLVRDVAQPRIVAAQPAPLSIALIPGRGGAWVYVEGDGATVSCAGCALGPAQVNGAVRTYTVRPFWPGWQVTATRGVQVVTVTHGTVVRLPWVGR